MGMEERWASSDGASAEVLRPASADRARRFRARGLSLIELLISVAITAMLLTATMVAIDASFKAYASAAESASTQTTTRLTVHRLLTLIRTSTAHGPLTTGPKVSLSDSHNDTLVSPFIELIDTKERYVRIEFRNPDESGLGELWITTGPAGTSERHTRRLLGGVEKAEFFLHRRTDEDGVQVLQRASANITIQPDDDSTLSIEDGQTAPIQVVASTQPRRLN